MSVLHDLFIGSQTGTLDVLLLLVSLIKNIKRMLPSGIISKKKKNYNIGFLISSKLWKSEASHANIMFWLSVAV